VGEGVVLPIYTYCSGFVIGQMRRHVETAAMFKAVQNLMTVILSEVGVLNTGISSLINTNL
jgi:hypothetical protein